MKKEEKTSKKRKIRKILKYIFLIVVIMIVVNTMPSLFYHSSKNDSPLQPVYRKGVYHVHSIYSDGRGTVEDIMKAAGSLGLDFVVLTDHGRPNLKSSGSTGWRNNVLLIGGSEFSLNCGHLAVMGYRTPDYMFPPEPQEAIDEIVKGNDNGVCFIAHPFDNRIAWKDWDVSDFSGLEVLSSYSEARKAGLLKLLVFPLKYLINSKYALLNTMNYPIANIKKWDELNKDADMLRQYSGIYALDAHAKIPLTKKIFLALPSYKAMFEIMTVYVRTTETREMDAYKAADVIVRGLRQGQFFNVMEAIAPANGFDAFFVDDEMGRRMEMGEATWQKKGKLVVMLPMDFDTEIKVIKDGVLIERIINKQKKWQKINIAGRGVYRLELYVRDNMFCELPWIITNPFYVGMKPAQMNERVIKKMGVTLQRRLPDDDDGVQFIVEKNKGSEGVIEQKVVVDDVPEGVTRFRFKLGKNGSKEIDFWSVMALRKELNLSGYRGVVFETRGNKQLRFWVEFRTGEEDRNGTGESGTSYRHSFLVTPEWHKVVIPFEKFHAYFGKKQVLDMNIVKIRSLFIGINNVVAYEGTEGELLVKNLGVY